MKIIISKHLSICLIFFLSAGIADFDRQRFIDGNLTGDRI